MAQTTVKTVRQSPALSYHFVEQSTSDVLTLDQSDTLATVRQKVHTATKEYLGKTWDVDQKDIVHPSFKSVVIFSDSCGLIPCDKDTQLASEVCEKSLLALIPSPLNSKMGHLPIGLPVQAPFLLQSPLLSCKKRNQRPSGTADDNVARIIQQLQEKMDGFEEKLRETSADNIALKQDNSALKQDIIALKQDNTALKQDNSALKQDIVALKQANSAFKQANKALERRVTEQAQDLKAQQQSLSKLQAQNESLQHQVEELGAVQEDHAGWIHSQDTNLLDRIKARHLLTLAQEKLALIAGIGGTGDGVQEGRVRGSHAWKEALGPSKVLSDRLTRARRLLDDITEPLDAKLSAFIQSDEGMRLVSEYNSPIRTMGDRAAHPPTTPVKLVRDAVMRHDERVGLSAIMHFVCEA